MGLRGTTSHERTPSWWRGRSKSPRCIPTSPSRLRGGVPGAGLDRESQMSKSTRSPLEAPSGWLVSRDERLDFIGRCAGHVPPPPPSSPLLNTLESANRLRRARGAHVAPRDAHRLGHRLYLLEPISKVGLQETYRPRFVKRASRKLKCRRISTVEGLEPNRRSLRLRHSGGASLRRQFFHGVWRRLVERADALRFKEPDHSCGSHAKGTSWMRLSR